MQYYQDTTLDEVSQRNLGKWSKMIKSEEKNVKKLNGELTEIDKVISIFHFQI